MRRRLHGRSGEKGRYKNPARPHLGIASQRDKGDAAGVKNEIRVSEPSWAQVLLTFCTFSFTHIHRNSSTTV